MGGAFPLSGSGHSAEPEPCSTVSAETASVPNAVADRLREARALIEGEGAWAQGDYARDAYGNTFMESEGPFECFCALGAISMAVRSNPDADYSGPELKPLERLLASAIGVPDDAPAGTSIVDWNDTLGRTQAEVLAAFDRAIELAEAGQ